jgi:hypothetical protein
VFTLTGCREWQTSRSGPRLVKQHCGLPALLLAPTRQTAEPPLRASWRQTPSPRACVQSWPTGPPGRGAPRTSCGCARRVLARVRLEALHGPKTLGRLPAGCGGRRLSCGPLGSRSHFLEKGGRGQDVGVGVPAARNAARPLLKLHRVVTKSAYRLLLSLSRKAVQ